MRPFDLFHLKYWRKIEHDAGVFYHWPISFYSIMGQDGIRFSGNNWNIFCSSCICYGEDAHEHWIVVATAAVEPCWLTISCINPTSIKVPPVEAPVSDAPLCWNSNKNHKLSASNQNDIVGNHAVFHEWMLIKLSLYRCHNIVGQQCSACHSYLGIWTSSQNTNEGGGPRGNSIPLGLKHNGESSGGPCCYGCTRTETGCTCYHVLRASYKVNISSPDKNDIINLV